MGQTITVSVRGGGRPEVRFFECNRSITGMAIEVYSADAPPGGPRPPDVLARRLIEIGAQRVTVYSNVVTVEAPAAVWSALEGQVVRAVSRKRGGFLKVETNLGGAHLIAFANAKFLKPAGAGVVA